MAFGESKYAECDLIDGVTKFVAFLLEVFISKLTGIRKGGDLIQTYFH
jgi:hypothetical protein